MLLTSLGQGLVIPLSDRYVNSKKSNFLKAIGYDYNVTDETGPHEIYRVGKYHKKIYLQLEAKLRQRMFAVLDEQDILKSLGHMKFSEDYSMSA